MFSLPWLPVNPTGTSFGCSPGGGLGLENSRDLGLLEASMALCRTSLSPHHRFRDSVKVVVLRDPKGAWRA